MSYTLFLLNACSKNEVDLPKPDEVNQSLTIDEAKAFYMSNAKHLRTSENDKGKLVFWEDFKEFKGEDKADYISVPYVDLNGLIIEIEDPRKEYKQKEDKHAETIKTAMIFKKDKGELKGFLLHSIADEYKKEKLESKNFTGYSILRDLEGNRIEFALFKNGKQTHSSKTNSKSRPSSYLEVCYTASSIACWNGGQTCGEIQTETTCEIVWVNNGSGGWGSVSTITYNNGGGGFGSVSSLFAFSSVSGFWDWFPTLNQTEKDYFMWRWNLVPGAIAAYVNAKALVQLHFCSDVDAWNGNAFKHAIWSALLFRYVGKHNAMDITNNHEAEENPNDDIVAMDYANNDLGIREYQAIYNSNILSGFTGEGEKIAHIRQVILDAIATGRGVRVLNGQLTATDGSGRCY